VDDFFSKPYESSATDAAVSEDVKAAGTEPVGTERRPAGRVSALLGGKKK
jgi:hypothetical protein